MCFRGCRAWANGDDGWDFYYSRFQIIVEDCWTFRNGIKGGNGNGFKSNGSASSSSTPRTQAPHVYIRCIAFDHKYKAGSNNKGFDQNHNEGNVSMINCLSFDNEKNFAYQEDTQNGKNHVLRNCVAFEPYSEKLARTLLPGEVINAGTKDEISYNASNTWFGNTIDAAFNSWNISAALPTWNQSRAHYESLTLADANAPRKADGSLPENGFGRLKPESTMKNAGISYNWELIQALNSYPSNPHKPFYVKSTFVTTNDGMPDLGPFEIATIANPDNQLPFVSLIQPTTENEFNLNEKISISATATDTDGSIARVEFFANNNLIGISYTSPYRYEWICTVAGNYALTAKAFDNEGGSALSTPIEINVKDDSGVGELGSKKLLLQLAGNSFTDAIQNKTWTTVNSTSISNNRIKLTYSSSKGGTIISPSIDLSKYLPDSLTLTFASSGGGNRNLNVYVSSDGGVTYSSAYVQAGAANGVAVNVKMKISDKVTGQNNFVLKLEAANTIELWNVQVTGFEKTISNIKPISNSLLSSIRSKSTITRGNLIFDMDLQQSTFVQIDLYNSQGVYVTNIEKRNYTAGKNNVIADISQLPTGLYFVRFKVQNESFTFKILKK